MGDAMISVVLCARNGEAYLGAQLESIRDQTKQPDQLLICDDDSRDQSLQIAQAFSKSAAFEVRILENSPPLGVAANFANGILNASGDIIFLSDQDDVWMPKKIETYLARFNANPTCMMVTSDSMISDEHLTKTGATLWKNERFRSKQEMLAFAQVLQHSPFPGHSMAIRRELVRDLLPIPKQWFYDQWISKLAAMRGDICAMREPMTIYRQHSSQVIGSGEVSLLRQAQEQPTVPQDYYSDEQIKFEALLKRAKALKWAEGQNATEIISLISEKIGFLVFRSEIRKLGNRRFFPIAGRLLSGDYSKYSRGWLSAARDMVG